MDRKTMRGVGYHLNDEILKQEFLQGTGSPLTDQGQRYFQGMTPYLVLAYRQGLEGRPLTEVFHFLEAVE